MELAYKARNRQPSPSYCHMGCSQVEAAGVIAGKKYGWLVKYDQATRFDRPEQSGASRANGFDLIGVHAVSIELGAD